MNNEEVSMEEMKYLKNTNMLLNQCVDHDFYQQAVDILSQTTIEKLERTISEKVISNFQKAH